MFRKQLFNTKIQIEKLDKRLSNDNRWISEYVAWKEIWASILLKDISSKRALYLFTAKWTEDFPQKFRVKVNEKFFIPTQSVIADPTNDAILFHAVLVQ